MKLYKKMKKGWVNTRPKHPGKSGKGQELRKDIFNQKREAVKSEA